MSHQIWESRQINICQLLGWEPLCHPASELTILRAPKDMAKPTWEATEWTHQWRGQWRQGTQVPCILQMAYNYTVYIYVIYMLYICECKKNTLCIQDNTWNTCNTNHRSHEIPNRSNWYTTSKSFPKSPYKNNIMHNKNNNDNNNSQFSLEPCTPCLFTHHWSPYRASRARLPQTTAMIGMKGCSSLR